MDLRSSPELETCAAHLTVVAGLALEASAQVNLTIPWYTIDGGGAFHTAGGSFRVSGTIGQPDAGSLQSGAFAVTGGFWSTTLPLHPRLRITPNGPNVRLAWPNPSSGYRLEEAADLSAPPGSWSPVGVTPSVVGDEKQVNQPRTASRRYYRLVRP